MGKRRYGTIRQEFHKMNPYIVEKTKARQNKIKKELHLNTLHWQKAHLLYLLQQELPKRFDSKEEAIAFLESCIDAQFSIWGDKFR